MTMILDYTNPITVAVLNTPAEDEYVYPVEWDDTCTTERMRCSHRVHKMDRLPKGWRDKK